MVWLLGNPKDFDGWGATNPGWAWKDLSNYWEYIVSKWQTTHVENDVYMQRLLNVGTNQGFTENPDINNFTKYGPAGVSRRYFSGVLETPSFARRTSVWTQLVKPVISKENLDIYVYSRAHKIIFQGTKAVGVLIQDPISGRKTILRANKEVIIAGGVFDTPKLLMLSGVGPKKDLKKLGISVVADVPGVGKKSARPHFSFTFISPS